MDGSRVYFTDQQLVQPMQDVNNENENYEVAGNKFMHFIRECQVRNTYIYREQLKSNAQSVGDVATYGYLGLVLSPTELRSIPRCTGPKGKSGRWATGNVSPLFVRPRLE